MPSKTSARGSTSAMAARRRGPRRRDQRQSFPAPGLPWDAMYSTAKPSSPTTGAAAESVKKIGSNLDGRRRAIANERVTCPRPVPFEVTKRIRSAPVIATSSSEPLIRLDQRPRGVVPLPLELGERAPIAAREDPGARAPGALAPAPPPDLLGVEAPQGRARLGAFVDA